MATLNTQQWKQSVLEIKDIVLQNLFDQILGVPCKGFKYSKLSHETRKEIIRLATLLALPDDGAESRILLREGGYVAKDDQKEWREYKPE